MTETFVRLVTNPRWRNVEIVCPACKHRNFEKVEADAPLQSGRVECHCCGATLRYEEVV